MMSIFLARYLCAIILSVPLLAILSKEKNIRLIALFWGVFGWSVVFLNYP